VLAVRRGRPGDEPAENAGVGGHRWLMYWWAVPARIDIARGEPAVTVFSTTTLRQ